MKLNSVKISDVDQQTYNITKFRTSFEGKN